MAKSNIKITVDNSDDKISGGGKTDVTFLKFQILFFIGYFLDILSYCKFVFDFVKTVFACSYFFFQINSLRAMR